MLEDQTENARVSNTAHSESWSHIAANEWLPKSSDNAARNVVVKPVEIDGQIIIFPVKICPPGSASGLEKPKPKPIVEGGSCSPK